VKLIFLLALSTLAEAQDMNMPGPMADMNPAAMSLMNLASGTSANPAAWNMPMLMMHLGSWNTMFMGLAYIVDTQQSGPRGGDKFYSPNWFMASAEHRAGAKGAFQADLMLSLDPATITGERYPLLFQTGETAYGRALVDAQHPHNFVMALGLHYAYELSENTTIDFYAAPVGDPALGPVAYPHRASAAELPQATISHHLQDSTHISDDVVTVGISHNQLRLEASGAKIAGSSSRAPSIPGPRASGISPARTGRRRFPWDGSRIRKRWSPATKSAPLRRSAIPAEAGHRA
jgi:hypothetical protein